MRKPRNLQHRRAQNRTHSPLRSVHRQNLQRAHAHRVALEIRDERLQVLVQHRRQVPRVVVRQLEVLERPLGRRRRPQTVSSPQIPPAGLLERRSRRYALRAPRQERGFVFGPSVQGTLTGALSGSLGDLLGQTPKAATDTRTRQRGGELPRCHLRPDDADALGDLADVVAELSLGPGPLRDGVEEEELLIAGCGPAAVCFARGLERVEVHQTLTGADAERGVRRRRGDPRQEPTASALGLRRRRFDVPLTDLVERREVQALLAQSVLLLDRVQERVVTEIARGLRRVLRVLRRHRLRRREVQ